MSKEDKATQRQAAKEEAARKRSARKEELAKKKAAKKEAAARKKAERKAKVEAKRSARRQKAAARKAGKAGGVEETKAPAATGVERAAAETGSGSRKEIREQKKAARKAEAEAKKQARRARRGEKKTLGRKKAAEAETEVISPVAPVPTTPETREKTRKRKGAFGGSKYSPVGLDIGRSSLAAVRLQHQTGGSTLLSAALDQLPEGIISDGEVQDVDALSHALRNFWKSHRIKGKKVALGLASQKVVVRTLDFPILDKKELRNAIEFQAQDYIPIPIEEAVFDFHVMGRFTDEEGIEKQKVLVVAAQKSMVMDFIDALKKARLVIAGIDLQAFALLRSFSKASFLDEGAPTGQAMAIVNIASDVTNMIIAANGEPQFTRITAFGGDNFTSAVQQQLGVSFAEAESLKAQIGLPAPGVEGANNTYEPPEGVPPEAPGEEGPQGPAPESRLGPGGEAQQGPPEGWLPPQGGDFLEGPRAGMPGDEGKPGEGQPGMPGHGAPGGEQPEGEAPEGGQQPGGGEPGGPGGPGQQGPGMPTEPSWPQSEREADEDEQREMVQAVQRALEVTVDTFADDLRRSLDYYSSQEDSLPIGSLVLSGGGSLLPNLVEHLSSMFSFEVKIGSPLGRIARNKSNLTDEELQALSPRLAIAIGLALEDEE